MSERDVARHNSLEISQFITTELRESETYSFYHFRALLGFVSRQEAEEFLKSSEVGTFLIRFSDSELGGVTVAWGSCKH